MDRYSSESSDSDGQQKEKTLDFSYQSLSDQTLNQNIEQLSKKSKESYPENINTLYLNQNQLIKLPPNISKFYNLKEIDLSNNRLKHLPEELTRFPLTTLVAKNNLLDNDSLPKSFESLNRTLQNFNLSGNNLKFFPEQIFNGKSLKYVYLGGNQIEDIPKDISRLTRLQVLCMGGNRLTDVHENVGLLKELKALILSDNLLESLPHSIANLNNLKTLQLHKNRLRTLPTEIIALKCLSELSLRDNPLVVRFVSDMTYNPPSLLELAGRTIKTNDVPVTEEELPYNLREYLASAHRCVNPKCKGVFFDNRVEHIKFVDFCGKYRVPLLQYLCSSKCVVNNSAIQGDSARSDIMKKVLLG